jgi:Leucine-rich repeat (LRR) protein
MYMLEYLCGLIYDETMRCFALKRLFSVFACSFIILSMTGHMVHDVQAQNSAEDQEIIFKDPNLEAAVRKAVPGRHLTVSSVKTITHLQCNDCGITDLSGIEQLTSLKLLRLSRNSISDISMLSALNSLEYLYLDYNNINDLKPLAGLTSLKHLHLGVNSISNIEPWKTCPL